MNITFKSIVILLLSLICVTAYAKKDNYHHPEAFLKSIKGNKHPGKIIYTKYCATCHAEKPIISLGAPAIGDKKAWAHHMKEGIKHMLKSVDIGKNNMPPRGGCFECSDEQLVAAIKYMLPKKK